MQQALGGLTQQDLAGVLLILALSGGLLQLSVGECWYSAGGQKQQALAGDFQQSGDELIQRGLVGGH